MDDPTYVAKEETFERWYENPLDLPGRWYLQAIGNRPVETILTDAR
jgi:hypothetical protein